MPPQQETAFFSGAPILAPLSRRKTAPALFASEPGVFGLDAAVSDLQEVYTQMIVGSKPEAAAAYWQREFALG